MTAFYNSKGGNQIDVVVNSKRAVKCWMWGTYNGMGYCRNHNDNSFAKFFSQTGEVDYLSYL
jgi:hypothetical protein